MDALVLALLSWIGANAGLTVSHAPSIAFVSPSAMRDRHGVEGAHAAFTLHALYSKSVIYLPSGWQPTGNREKSILLHELVHHAQRINNVAVPCQGALERQAYDLQMQWLREQGEPDPYGLIGTDEFTIAVLFSCPDENTRM